MQIKIFDYINSFTIVQKLYFNYKRRTSLYYIISQLTGYSLTFIDTIHEIQTSENLGHEDEAIKAKTPLYYILQTINDRQEAGQSIAHSMRSYVPESDTMMISAFEEQDISKGFSDLVKFNNSLKAMQNEITSAISYPLFLVSLLFGVLTYFCLSLIPQLTVTMTPTTHLSTTSAIMIWMSKNYWLWSSCVLGFITVLILFLVWALPNMNNKFRISLENIPPFSLYRIRMGCTFLSTLNGLTASGLMQVQAIEMMEHEAQPYLKSRLTAVLKQMHLGKNLGQALIDSKLNFPDKEMLKPIYALSKIGVLEESLEKLSIDLNEAGLELIKKQSSGLKFIMIALLGIGVMFGFSSMYSISQDMSSQMEQKI